MRVRNVQFITAARRRDKGWLVQRVRNGASWMTNPGVEPRIEIHNGDTTPPELDRSYQDSKSNMGSWH